MPYDLPKALLEEISVLTRSAFDQGGVVSISRLAADIRRQHAAANVALEDVEHAIFHACLSLKAAFTWDGLTESHPSPDSPAQSE